MQLLLLVDVVGREDERGNEGGCAEHARRGETC